MVATNVTNRHFQTEVIDSERLVLVDFWAPWCGPCRVVAPVVEAIAEQYADQVKVFKVNTDENPDLASQYQVQSIPTLIIFKEGQPVDTLIGAVPQATIAAALDKHL